MDNIHFLSGLESCKKAQFDEAVRYFTQALELDAKHVPSLYNRGMVYNKLGSYKLAVSDFELALRFTPQDANLYSELGVAKHLLGNNAGALEDLDKAMALDPMNPYRFSSRAYVKAKMGKLDEAIEDYKKAISLDPEDEVAHNNLGMLEEQLGYQESAKRHYRMADRLTEKESGQYEKPDIDKLLAAHKKEKERLKAREHEIKTANYEPQSKKISVQYYLKTLKEVITSRKAFAEMVFFVKNGFKER